VTDYAAAGVSLAAGDRAVELMKAAVERTARPEVVGGIGGFAGLFDASALRDYHRPLLATATDGVGTKIEIARRMGRHDTIGIDLVAMVLDDLVVCGAEPLFMTDYIATGMVVPDTVATIVGGIAEGCHQAGAALVGGETAEHPGLMAPDEYDVAGAGVGVVEADALLGPHRVQAGDVLVAMPSSGLHSNGYSLVRHICFTQAGWDVHTEVAGLPRPLGEELLEPTRIYAKDCLALASDPASGTHAFAHVTGGGLAANLARSLPDGVTAVVERGSWRRPAIIDVLAQAGELEAAEVERAFNVGVGMVAVVAAEAADAATALLRQRGLAAWVCGSVAAGTVGQPPSARLVGHHPG